MMNGFKSHMTEPEMQKKKKKILNPQLKKKPLRHICNEAKTQGKMPAGTHTETVHGIPGGKSHHHDCLGTTNSFQHWQADVILLLTAGAARLV